MKTRNYLILMVTAILIPTVIFAAYGLKLLLEQEREARIGMVEAKARSIALDIDQDIAHAEGILKVIASTNHLQKGNYAGLYQLMTRNRSPGSWTVLYDQDGRMLINTYAPFDAALPDIREDWVPAAIAAQKIESSNLHTGSLSKLPVISINLPVRAASGRQYLLSQVFPSNYFTKTVVSHNNPDSWIIGIHDASGITITRNRLADQLVGKPVKKEIMEAASRQKSGTLRNISRENIPIYAVFTHTERTNWLVAIGVPENEIEAPARRAVMYGALAMLVVFGVATLMVLFLGRRLTGAFGEAVSAARSLGTGDIPEIRKSSVCEADMLQLALHDAGVSLAEENRSRQLLEQEREKLLAWTQEAKRQAESQNKAKDEFLAMLAHELRNPLAPISAAADILKIAGTNETMIRHSSDVIARQVSHMTDLIDDLLDVSRVTRGLVKLEKEDIDIRTVVGHAIEQARPLIESRGHQIDIHMDTEQEYVHGDRTRLVQVICNLLNNAAKYTPHGGRITLSAEVHDTVQGKQVEISIADNGIGIDGALLPHVFELFRQAERTPDRSQGGLGLGLALAKSIMALHGGRIEAHSEGLGKGSRFTLILPTVAKTSGTAAAPKSHAEDAAPIRLHSILMVDDNLDAARSLAILLEAKGHQIRVEENGKAALREAQEHPAHVYILDIGLPDMNGYEVARQLRNRPENSHAMLIALTGYGQAHDKVLSKAAGFDHHFVKPLDLAKLDHILKQYTQSFESSDSNENLV